MFSFAGLLLWKSRVFREEAKKTNASRISAGEAILEIRWDTKRVGNVLLPSTSAIATMLAMTGWTDVRWYQDFRTVASAALLTARRAGERPSTYHGNPFGMTPHPLR